MKYLFLGVIAGILLIVLALVFNGGSCDISADTDVCYDMEADSLFFSLDSRITGMDIRIVGASKEALTKDISVKGGSAIVPYDITTMGVPDKVSVLPSVGKASCGRERDIQIDICD